MGLTITNNLSWNNHILSLIQKASRRLFILKKYKNILPRPALEQIYTSMIRPILEYGDVIYDSIPLSIGQSLENIQRQAAIACTGAYRHTKHSSLLSEVGWEPLLCRRKQHKATLLYKIIKKIYPAYLYRHIHFPPPLGYNLRHQQQIVPRYARLDMSIKSFFPSATREWNRLPLQVRNSVSVLALKSRLRDSPRNIYKKLSVGTKGIWLSRLRMELSPLNYHRRRYNFIQFSTCPSCNTQPETIKHFFFTCPTYSVARRELLDSLQNDLGLDTQNLDKLIETILHGKHIRPDLHTILYNQVCKYMADTHRFM